MCLFTWEDFVLGRFCAGKILGVYSLGKIFCGKILYWGDFVLEDFVPGRFWVWGDFVPGRLWEVINKWLTIGLVNERLRSPQAFNTSGLKTMSIP